MDRDEARRRLLEAAEELFYSRGIHAVGMDQVRDHSGVSLARLYDLFPSKQHLVAGYLRSRDERWRRSLAAHVEVVAGDGTARDRLLAVFGWLGSWFAEPGYRGCGFINAWAEAGPAGELVQQTTREHKTAFRNYLIKLAAEDYQPALIDQLYLLAEGAIVTSALNGSTEPATTGRTAAAALLAS